MLFLYCLHNRICGVCCAVVSQEQIFDPRIDFLYNIKKDIKISMCTHSHAHTHTYTWMYKAGKKINNNGLKINVI